MPTHGGVLYYVVKVPKQSGGLGIHQMSSASAPTTSVVRSNNDNGWENPFRPGGNLSREADEIVELIKGGKPITPIPSDLSQTDGFVAATNGHKEAHKTSPISCPLQRSPPATSANGAAKLDGKQSTTENSRDGAVNVKRATVKPDGDGSQVEQVTIKKKPKCNCCVIQ